MPFNDRAEASWPYDRQGRAIRSRRLRRHRRSGLPQALPGALSPRAQRSVLRADADHRSVAPSPRSRGVPRFGQGRADEIHVVDEEAGAAAERFLSRLDFVAVDATSDGGWADLRALLGADERIRAYYLATGPDLFGPLAKRLGAEGLVTSRSRIIVEKPIGETARAPRRSTTRSAPSSSRRNIFRIDHYLGKESVQNLMALRFANIAARAAVEQRPHRSRADHRRRDARRRGTRRLLRRSRRACATWCRTI